MKKYIFIVIGVVALSSTIQSCDNYDEQPPLNEGYSTTIVLPEAEFLTSADRAEITAMEEEYERNAK